MPTLATLAVATLAKVAARMRDAVCHCVAALGLLVCATSMAAESDWQFQHWTARSGLPSDSFNTILPLRDGHLLLSSYYAPPSIFDGSEFKPLHLQGPAAGQLFGSAHAAEDKNGDLWFATMDRGLLYRDRNGRVESVNAADGPLATIRHLLIDRAGDVLVGYGKGVARVRVGHGPPHVAEPMLTLPAAVSSQFQDSNGDLWIGTERGLFLSRDGELQAIDEPALAIYIWHIMRDSGGRLWVATRGNGLARLDASGWHYFNVGNGFVHDVVRHIVDDGEGGLWVATAGGGVVRIRDDEVIQHFDGLSGLRGDSFLWLHRDAAGNLWAISPGTGLQRLAPSAFTRWHPRDGLASGFTWTVFEDNDGSLWAGGNAGMSRRDGAGAVVIGAPGSGYQASVRGFLRRAEGDLLVATDGGLFAFDGKHHRLFEATRDIYINSIVRDAKGTIWAAGGKLWRVEKEQVVEAADVIALTAGSRAQAVYPRADGSLDIATQRAGIWRWRDGRLAPWIGPEVGPLRALWTDPDGRLWYAGEALGWIDAAGKPHPMTGVAQRYGRGIHGFVEDGHGGIWLPSNVGLLRFEIAALRTYAEGRSDEPTPQRFGIDDGLSSTEFNGGVQTPGLRDREGMLWFASTNGLTRVDPTRLGRPNIPANVKITQVDADDQRHAAMPELSLPAGTRRVSISYTALPAAIGGEAQFAYRLLPVLPDWISAGSGRRALFPGLDPGDYRFEVRALIPSQGGKASVASLDFSLQPSLWQRQSVRWSAAGLALLALATLPSAHIFALRGQRRRLLDEVAEKTEALENLAATDPLTGLANRRRFDIALTAALQHRNTGLLLIDIDHFKRYNDALGHAAGDLCLRELAKVLTACVRNADDLVARLGGEEFAVLLAANSEAALSTFAERIQSSLQDRALAHPDSPTACRITLSIGGVLAHADSTPGSLFEAADLALYAAKHDGRNCIRLRAIDGSHSDPVQTPRDTHANSH